MENYISKLNRKQIEDACYIDLTEYVDMTKLNEFNNIYWFKQIIKDEHAVMFNTDINVKVKICDRIFEIVDIIKTPIEETSKAYYGYHVSEIKNGEYIIVRTFGTVKNGIPVDCALNVYIVKSDINIIHDNFYSDARITQVIKSLDTGFNYDMASPFYTLNTDWKQSMSEFLSWITNQVAWSFGKYFYDVKLINKLDKYKLLNCLIKLKSLYIDFDDKNYDYGITMSNVMENINNEKIVIPILSKSISYKVNTTLNVETNPLPTAELTYPGTSSEFKQVVSIDIDFRLRTDFVNLLTLTNENYDNVGKVKRYAFELKMDGKYTITETYVSKAEIDTTWQIMVI